MKNTPLPSFASPDLQEAVREARLSLEGFDDARNKISTDIKVLEGYLRDLDLKTDFRLDLGKYFIEDAEQSPAHVAAALECGGCASGFIGEDSLVWGEHKGAFRLLFESTRWEGEVAIDIPGGPFFWNESTAQREVKPLIETKFEVRKRMYSHLPRFVRELSEHLAVPEQQPLSRVLEEDIPFDIPF